MATASSSPLIRKLALTGVCGSLISLAGLLGKYHWLFDLFSHFRVQYVVLGLIALVFSLLARTHLFSLITMLCLGLHAAEIAPLVQHPWNQPGNRQSIAADSPAAAHAIRLMNSNLLRSNKKFESQVDYINDTEPDIIVFLEYTPAWDKALSMALQDYPHRVAVPVEGSFGIAAYSKLPLEASSSSVDTSFYSAAISISVVVGGKPLQVFGMHPPPPMSPGTHEERNRQLAAMAQVTASLETPYALLGDLNITPWSNFFKDFARQGNLADSRRANGIFPTWPVPVFPLQIPIDYVLVSPHIEVAGFGSSGDLGSDHRAVWADIVVGN